MAAAARAQEASSSMSRCTYHAFLSFRGDTRKNFTDHLYTALVQAGIHTFRDDDEIERGENIEAELQKAIKESKISIIVFSRDYASSRWCLDELVMIMERRRTGGHTVVPVFYDVDPSLVRKQMGSFAEAFAIHEKRFEEEMDKVERWRAALREVADLGGMVLDNRHESQFVQNIVREIGNKLNRTALHVDAYLVGLDSRLRDINLWVQDGSNDVGIAMIYGIGGIGKTTIAKTVYNLNFDRFEGRSFLGNVRETIEQPNGLVRLQRQLLSDILREKTSKIYNADKGINKIKDAICCRRVFLVLDDVDQLDQLNAIIGIRKWFYPGSKIIITTRHEHLLRSREVCEKFKVKQMDDDESLQLFSWHAFGQGHPIEGYMECSRSVVHHCGGLPLALQVLGSSLSGKSINVWGSELQKLEAIPHSKIQKILKISYDSLEDDHDQNLFLDIACFFIGKDKDYTAGILDGCGFYPMVGFQNLIDRCLLTITENKRLMMHQLLRDMGREIVRQESTDDPGKRSRLWRHKEALTVLKEKTGTETIKGLTLDLRRLMEDKQGKTIVCLNYAKRLHHENSLEKSMVGNCSKRRRLGFFSWQQMNTGSANSFPLSNDVDLETKTFMMMQKVKLLQLNYVNLKGDYGSLPKNLIWLCWHRCPLNSVPTDFRLEKLVALDMRYSSLKYVWKGTRVLAELKFLNLSHCHVLVRTPDFSRIPMLERLKLKDCINLVEVDESVGNLDRLVLLNLKDCINLRKLPRKVGLLKFLEKLILSGCSKLDELPEDLGKMESLKVLHADRIAMNQLLSTTSDTKKFSLFSARTWHSILPSFLSPRKGLCITSISSALLPHSLVTLSLADNNLSDDAISYGLSSLPSLKFLDLSGNPVHSLSKSITGLTMLEDLKLERCTKLRLLPELPKSLFQLNLGDCTSLEIVPKNPTLSLFYSFDVYGCSNLDEIQGIFKLEPIRKIDTKVIESLGLSELESLESIEVDLFSNITRQMWKTPLQVLQECNVLSIFLPRSEVPSNFIHSNFIHRSMGSSISVNVPSRVGYKVCGFNLCALYAFDLYEEYAWIDHTYWAKISNKTKRIRWNYAPICYAIRGDEEENDMLWLSHWKLGDQLEGGDQIDVSVVLPFEFQVKMCGICFVYEDEEKVRQSNSEETVLSNYPWYQILTLTQAGACHHSYTTHLLGHHLGRDFKYDYFYEPNPQVELETCTICEDISKGF